MKISSKYLLVKLNWEQAISKIYEYMISKSLEFFGVKNSEFLIFRIENMEDSKSLFMALYNRSNFEGVFPLTEEEVEKLPFTEQRYSVLNKTVKDLATVNFYFQGERVLSNGEIRYVKLNLDSILNLLSSIIYMILKDINKIKYDYFKSNFNKSTNEFTLLFAQDYEDIVEDNIESNIVDISKGILNKFL